MPARGKAAPSAEALTGDCHLRSCAQEREETRPHLQLSRCILTQQSLSRGAGKVKTEDETCVCAQRLQLGHGPRGGRVLFLLGHGRATLRARSRSALR
jgi:hypothetical protein